MLLGRYAEGSFIDFSDNKLTRFESGVFQSVLKQMVAYGGVPFTYVNIQNSRVFILPCNNKWKTPHSIYLF